MKCKECQFENPEGMKFCGECGHNLSSPFEPTPKDLSYEERLAKIQRYLPKGLTEKILAQKDKIEGERKQVTVMFCDMAGFTGITETLGPEKVYSLMDEVYELLIHKVHEYEGTVNEMTGDGIMAVFGAPIALEDAPQRAIRSALAIHREIAKFNEQKKGIIPIRMRIGIHTGPVVLGTLGNDLRVEFKAVGDTVNLASRMEGLAEPGTTYVTKETFRLTEELFRFQALGEKPVKGKEAAVSVYKLLSAKKDVYRPRLGSERMIYSEMVGRNRELDRLELQLMKAINGEGSIVNIIGEAGIGKSRLVAELKGREVIKRVTFLEGRAISIGRNLSFHPIIDLLKHWARIKEDDGEATAFNKLETAVKRVYPEGVGEVLPFVAILMGMRLSGRYAERVKGIEGEALEKLILKNVRDLLIKATELTPLVIVAEDLHWADVSSIEFMELLFRLAETQRILFVNVFRPDHRGTGDRIVETLKEELPAYYVEIVLEPLDERMSESLVKKMLNISGLPRVVMDQIVKRADGNPFFIEEIVRSFIDEGSVVVKNGAFEVTEKIHTMVIPHTINDVLMARIDRLEEKTRSLVKVASVIGRNFFYRVLTEVATTIEDIDKRLSYLKDIQLIREWRRMEELEYLFKHALAQEVAYESILPRKRKKLHLKVANSIEKVFQERLKEFHGILSYHYSNGEDLDKAEEYILKAGEEALKSSASNEALYYYQRAIEIYIKKYGDALDSNKIAEFEENIGIAFLNKGNYVEAVDYFDRSLVSRGGKVQRNIIISIIKLITNLSIIIRNLYLPPLRKKKIPSQLDNQIMNRTLTIAKAVAAVDMKRAFVDNIAALKQCFKFDLSKSQIYFDTLSGCSFLFSASGISFNISGKILDYARKSIVNKDAKITLQIYKAVENLHNFLTGNWYEEMDKDLIDNALKVGDVFSVRTYLCILGHMKIALGDFETSQNIIKKMKDIDDEFGDEHAELDFYYFNAKLLMKKRELYDAIKYANDGIALADKMDWVTRKIQFLAIKSRIQIMQNDLETAEGTINEGRNLVLKEGKHSFLSHHYSDFLVAIFSYNLARLERSIVANDKKNIFKYKKAASKNGKRAAKHSRKKVASNRTEAYKLMGIYYWFINKEKKALRCWENSIKEGERLGAKLELSKTYYEVGKRLLEKKSEYKQLNGIKAEEYLNKARTMFEEMDLRWDLEELDRIAAYG